MEIKIKNTNKIVTIGCIDPRTGSDVLLDYIPSKYDTEYGITDDQAQELTEWSLRIEKALSDLEDIIDVSDQEIQESINIDCEHAADDGDYADGLEAVVAKWALK